MNNRAYFVSAMHVLQFNTYKEYIATNNSKSVKFEVLSAFRPKPVIGPLNRLFCKLTLLKFGKPAKLIPMIDYTNRVSEKLDDFRDKYTNIVNSNVLVRELLPIPSVTKFTNLDISGNEPVS